MTISPAQDPIKDQFFMRQALRYALRSTGQTWPNPGVGCVIVKNDKVIGRGRHERCGEAHAEVNALEDVKKNAQHSHGATAYVTLAPCTTQGRQGPCSTALIQAGIQRVVAALPDPVQEAAGPIFAAEGIRYETGVLQKNAEELHAGFLMRVLRGRPRITGKWAQSVDGFIAAEPGKRTQISSSLAMNYMRRRRRHFDAIIIGAETARCDQPRLLGSWDKNVPKGNLYRRHQHPLRIVLCRNSLPNLSPHSLHSLAENISEAGLWFLASSYSDLQLRHQWEQFGARCIEINTENLQEVTQFLGAEGLNEIIVEGGAALHQSFLTEKLYDRIECYFGEQELGAGLAGPDWSVLKKDFDSENPVSYRVLQGTDYRVFSRLA